MFRKNKQESPVIQPSLCIGMACDFSKVVFIHTDAAGNRTETVIHSSGQVNVDAQTAEDFFFTRDEYAPGTGTALNFIRSADKILAEHKMTVKRALVTQPILPKEERTLGL